MLWLEATDGHPPFRCTHRAVCRLTPGDLISLVPVEKMLPQSLALLQTSFASLRKVETRHHNQPRGVLERPCSAVLLSSEAKRRNLFETHLRRLMVDNALDKQWPR